MVIVAGHLIVDPSHREDYLAGCAAVVEQGRRAPGKRTRLLRLRDPGRINVFERWDSQDAVDAFRGSGPSDEQAAMFLSASVSEYDMSDERGLT